MANSRQWTALRSSNSSFSRDKPKHKEPNSWISKSTRILLHKLVLTDRKLINNSKWLILQLFFNLSLPLLALPKFQELDPNQWAEKPLQMLPSKEERMVNQMQIWSDLLNFSMSYMHLLIDYLSLIYWYVNKLINM